MKTPITKPAEAPQTPAFQISVRQRAAKPQAAALGSKTKKRDNIFSKSRDTYEDRGTREMKTSQNPQTFPHTRESSL